MKKALSLVMVMVFMTSCGMFKSKEQKLLEGHEQAKTDDWLEKNSAYRGIASDSLIEYDMDYHRYDPAQSPFYSLTK